MSELLLDRAGRRRSPATCRDSTPATRLATNGLRYLADPPKVEEIIAVMGSAGDRAHGRRLRAVIAILWRSGLRIQERSRSPKATSINAAARSWSGAARADAAEVGIDASGCEQLDRWIALRRELPIGPLFCVIDGVTSARHRAADEPGQRVAPALISADGRCRRTERSERDAGHTASMPPPLIEFPADDPERARQFWHGVLGVTLAPRATAAGSGWEADSDGLRLGVHRRGPGPGDTACLPYFTVADLATTVERVRELGGSIVHPGDRWAVCRDSEGSPFALAAATGTGE